MIDNKTKIDKLEQELKDKKEKLAEKMKNFKGVRHENALSELRYTEIRVLEDMIASLQREILDLKKTQ